MKLLRNLMTVLIVLVMVAVGVLFALQNKVPVPLDLLVYTFSPQSLALWILGAFAAGGGLGLLMSSIIMLRLRTSVNSCKRQLDKARTELDKSRDQSAMDSL